MPRSASLSWSGIFWPKPSIAEPGSEEDDDRSRSPAALHCPSVRTRLDLAGLILPSAGNRELGEPRAHAAHRRGVPRDAVVRRPSDGAASAAAGLVHRPQTSAAADEEDWPGADLAGAKDERAAPVAQDLPLPAAAHDDREAEPGLARRRHLHPDAARLPLPRRHHGLGKPQGPRLAAVEHHGGGLLRRGAE